MVLTLGYAEQELSEYVDGGSCDSKIIRKRINEAVRTLLRTGDYTSVDRYCLTAFDGCITLPPDVAYIRNIRIDGRTTQVHTQWFEFLSGHGDFGHSNHNFGCDGVTNRGEAFVTFADLPSPMHLIAVSDRKEDKDSLLFVSGTDEHGQPIRNCHSDKDIDVRFGENIDISDPNVRKATNNKFSTITVVDKPLTNGIVRLYGVDPEKNTTFMIGYYLPWETKPCYARYEIAGLSRNCPSRITILAKRKFVPLVHEDQILPISNLDAIADMLLSKNAQKNAQPRERIEFEQNARRALSEDLENTRSSESEFDVDLYNPETLEHSSIGHGRFH